MSTTPPVHVRLRAIRERLDLTQAGVAERSGKYRKGTRLTRDYMVKIEGGHSKYGTLRMRLGLAAGLGLTLETVNALIDRGLSVRAALSAASRAD